MEIQLKFDIVKPEVRLPEPPHMDIFALFDCIVPKEHYISIPTGLLPHIPHGFMLQILPKRHLAEKHAVTLMNPSAPIHSDSREEIIVILQNQSILDFHVHEGMAIAQLALVNAIPFIPISNGQPHGYVDNDYSAKAG